MSEHTKYGSFVLPKTKTKKQKNFIELSGNGISKDELFKLEEELIVREEENKANPPEN